MKVCHLRGREILAASWGKAMMQLEAARAGMFPPDGNEWEAALGSAGGNGCWLGCWRWEGEATCANMGEQSSGFVQKLNSKEIRKEKSQVPRA